MYFGKSELISFEAASRREWFVSNGLDSYSFGTACGANTRREHGLWVRRGGDGAFRVMVAKLEEEINFSGKWYKLSANKYRDLVYPDGYRYLQEFSFGAYPSFLYVVHDLMLEKSVLAPEGRRFVVVRYRLISSGEGSSLKVRPLFAHRGVFELNEVDHPFELQSRGGGLFCVKGRGETTCIQVRGSFELEGKPLWFEHVDYPLSVEEGLLGCDRLWSFGEIVLELEDERPVYLLFGPSPAELESVSDVEELFVRARREASSLQKRFSSTPMASTLALSARNLVFRDEKGRFVVLGLPSMGESSCDAFAALPGLCATSSDPEGLFGEVVERWVSRARDDFVPSGVDPSSGEPLFELAETGLWLAYAFDGISQQESGLELVERFWPHLQRVLRRYKRPFPELGLSMGEDGLLRLEGSKGHWMGSVVEGEEVAHRRGALVEVNALWYSALRTAERLASYLEDSSCASEFGAMADRVASSFDALFWNRERHALYDWVDGDERDATIRPNQLLAVALSSTPLEPTKARAVLESVWRELYTTYGIRTLEPGHGKYKGRPKPGLSGLKKGLYRGMAWPWLLALFVRAFLRYNPSRKDVAWAFVRPIGSHLREGCVGAIAQAFEGEMPYTPRGDVASSRAMGMFLELLCGEMSDL